MWQRPVKRKISWDFKATVNSMNVYTNATGQELASQRSYLKLQRSLAGHRLATICINIRQQARSNTVHNPVQSTTRHAAARHRRSCARPPLSASFTARSRRVGRACNQLPPPLRSLDRLSRLASPHDPAASVVPTISYRDCSQGKKKECSFTITAT
jgi:hypothetical protein